MSIKQPKGNFSVETQVLRLKATFAMAQTTSDWWFGT
jgi:hypothetical protein